MQSCSTTNGNATNNSSIEEIILEEPITLEEPAPNSSVEYLGETGIPMKNQKKPLAVIDLLDDTPNSSQDSGRTTVSPPDTAPKVMGQMATILTQENLLLMMKTLRS